MKIDRLLSIVIMLLNRDRVRAADLADHFDVSVRTIYRDIDAIHRAGIPIVTHQGNKGGLGIIDSYKLDRHVLTLQDMVAMLSVLKGVNSTLQDRRLGEAMEKIQALVPRKSRQDISSRLNQTVIDLMPWGLEVRRKEEMIPLRRAIHKGRLVRFSYRDAQGVSSCRTVEPMTLVFKATAWYLFGYCTLRHDFRLFRLTRISSLVTLETTFVRRQVDYDQYDQGGDEKVKMVRLVVRFSKSIQQTVEDYFAESCLDYLDNGDVLATFELMDNGWVLSYLLSLGDQAEVIRPRWMRLKLREKAKKIAALYKDDIQVS